MSWVDAKKQCEDIGKRLCTEEEFNFACEGEAMLPYTYGYERDAAKCNIDKPYRKREHKLFKYNSCMKKPQCKAELEARSAPADRLDASMRLPVRRLRSQRQHQRVGDAAQEKPRTAAASKGLMGPCPRPLPADRGLPQGRGLRLRRGLPLLQDAAAK